jgi:1-acyl-sn-glycerol-3-phosphate acyltransferase
MSSYVLINGKALLIFPEGGRSFDGNLMEFKKGVGILAKELDIPIIPAYVKGAYEALPRTAHWPKLTEITVVYGNPLRSSDVDFSTKPEGIDDYQFFADTLRGKVRDLQELQ